MNGIDHCRRSNDEQLVPLLKSFALVEVMYELVMKSLTDCCRTDDGADAGAVAVVDADGGAAADAVGDDDECVQYLNAGSFDSNQAVQDDA